MIPRNVMCWAVGHGDESILQGSSAHYHALRPRCHHSGTIGAALTFCRSLQSLCSQTYELIFELLSHEEQCYVLVFDATHEQLPQGFFGICKKSLLLKSVARQTSSSIAPKSNKQTKILFWGIGEEEIFQRHLHNGNRK